LALTTRGRPGGAVRYCINACPDGWDAEAQDWVLGAAFDYAYCHDCDEETRLEEVELGPD
jgi:hypothetical protein